MIMNMGSKIIPAPLLPLIPKMTSNTAPSGTASTSSYKSGYQGNAYLAFDGDVATNADVYYGSAFANNTYTIYTFANVQPQINIITLCARIDGAGTITTGSIDYSSNGTNWVTAVSLTSSNFISQDTNTGVTNRYVVNLQNVKAIRAGSTASSNGRGMIVRELQAYG